MASLEYVGRFPDSDYAVMHKAGVDARFRQVSVDQQTVDDAVIPRRSDLVLPSYVQQQDSLTARKTYVDQQDALYELKSDRGAANGIAFLDANGKVPSTQLPAFQDYTPRFYNATTPDNTNWASQGVTERTLHTFSVPDPGYPYAILCFGHVGVRSSGNWSHAFVEVRRNSTTGTTIAQGYGTESQSYHWIKVLPASNSGNAGVAYTGASTLYVRGAKVNGSGDANVQFTADGWSFSVLILPAL